MTWDNREVMSQSSPVSSRSTDTGDFMGSKYRSRLMNPPQLGGEIPQAGLLGGRERGLQKVELEKVRETWPVHHFAQGGTRRKGSFSGIQHGSQAVVVSRFYLLQPMLVCLGCHSKISQTGWPKQQKFPHSSGEMSAGLVSSEASLLGLQMAIFSLSLHVASLQRACVQHLLFWQWHQSCQVRTHLLTSS